MLSVGLITSDNKHLSRVLGLALDRFHIEITLNGATAGEALAHPEACGVDIWVARLPGERAETLGTLLPGRSDPAPPRGARRSG
ncbi:hypothetical protein [Streptomyces sp. RKND-216]|uniref:hypothetical protein n=1 Tax=Streptomyces sp. RKND-216 TaxID=2562581 RepID=UPI00144807A8|nr:hypothetical protein [Streptomyces sp. RKND-216]